MESPLVLKTRLEMARRRSPTSLSAEEVVARALEMFPGSVAVAWSGGKCSTAALQIAKRQCPDVPVAFNNTGVEFPETVKYVRRMAADWNLNYHELKPKTTFWAIVKEHGFPQIRGYGGGPRRPMCCQFLKEDPAARFYKEHGIKAVITGIRAEESRVRALTIGFHGQYYLAKRENLWKFHPVSLWSQSELDGHLEAAKVEINPVYCRGLRRCGCWPCTGFLSWREELGRTYPKLYKWLNREFQKAEGTPTLWEYEDSDQCSQAPLE